MEHDDSMLFYSVLGAKVRNLRTSLKLNQAQMADALKLSRTAYISIEKGTVKVPAHLLIEIAKQCGVEISALLPSPPNVSDRPLEETNWLKNGLKLISQQALSHGR